MTTHAWKIDEATYLARNEAGQFNIWWAGCYMGEWVNSLESIVEEPLLSQCRSLAATEPTHSETVDEYEVGGYGEGFTQRDVDFAAA